MKEIAILAVALLVIGMIGFAGAETSQANQADAVSAKGISPVGGFKVATTDGVAPNKKSINPSTVEGGRAVSPSSVASITPSISAEKVEESARAVTSAAVASKKAVGFPVSVSGAGQAVSSNGETVAVEISEVSQAYARDDGSQEETISEGIIVFAGEAYRIELENIVAGTKSFRVMNSKAIQIGELTLVEGGNSAEGELVIDGEAYQVDVVTQSQPLKAPAKEEVQSENVFVKIKGFFDKIFGRA